MDHMPKGSVLMTSAGGVTARQPLVLSDVIPGALVRDVLLVVGSAGLVGLLAQISIHLSFTPVPITGQTLGVLLTSTALGWRPGAPARLD
jgi:biotin transport system substrate-specific component